MPDNPAPDVVARLWDEYKRRGTIEARERLIQYSPPVKFVVGRVGSGLPPSVEQSDLVSYGIFGLIDAIEKFDPSRGLQVRDLCDRPHQRCDHRRAALDRLGAAFRSRQGRAIERAYSKLENELRRTPDDVELAHELDVSERELGE